MSALAEPPNRFRCRGRSGHSAQGPKLAATPLLPCGDPRLHKKETSLILRISVRSSTRGVSSENRRTLEVLASLGNDRFRKPRAAQVRQLGNKVRHPHRLTVEL